MNSAVSTRANDTVEPEFNLAALLDVLVLYRRMMLWIFGIIATLGLVVVFLADPEYQVDILTQVDESAAASTATSLLGQGLAAMFDVKSSADTEMQVLQSRLVVASAVDNLKLYITAEPVRFPIIGRAIARSNRGISTPGLLGFGGYAWGSESIKASHFEVPNSLEGEHYYLTVLPGQKYSFSGPGLDKDVVGEVGRAETFLTDDGPITLQIDSVNGNTGTRFRLTRDSRLETINQLQRKLSISELGKDSDILQVKLRGTNPKLITSILNDIAGQYVDQNVARKAEDAARSLDFLRGQVSVLKEKLDVSESEYAKVRATLRSVDIEGEAKTILQQSADNETQLAELQQKRAAAVTLFSETHPTVTALDKQIAVLQGQADTLKQRIDRLPGEQKQVLRVARDVKVNNDLYVGLLNNIEQLQLMRAGRIGNVRVLDNAIFPDRPMRYWRPVLSLVVVAFAAFAAVGSAWLRDLLFSGISDPHQIQGDTDLRVFSVVPLCRVRGFGWSNGMRRNKVGRRLLAFLEPDDPSVESLRSFRTGLQFSMTDAKNNVVMFAGPTPSIGKSFVSSNVAGVLARAGKRVLLIDCDLRRANLSHAYGASAKFGLTDVIAGKATVEQAVIKIEHKNLDFLAAGSHVNNAADYLTQTSVEAIFKHVSSLYDVVVLDTAPLLAVPDAAILAPLARGNVFLVARAGATRAGELVECARRLEQVDVTVKGVVLNGIDPQAGRFRYGAKYTSYSYRYAQETGDPAIQDER